MIGCVLGNASNTLSRELAEPKIAMASVRVNPRERYALPVRCEPMRVIGARRDGRGALTPPAVEPCK